MEIIIVSRPDGEAPDWVRDAWIGLKLPTDNVAPMRIRGFGVLSMPQTKIGQCFATMFGKSVVYNGHRVDASRAIELLKVHNPDAAQWWRLNTPDLLADGQHLIFEHQCCRPTIKPAAKP